MVAISSPAQVGVKDVIAGMAGSIGPARVPHSPNQPRAELTMLFVAWSEPWAHASQSTMPVGTSKTSLENIY